MNVPIEQLEANAWQLVLECFEREETGDDAVLILSHVAEPILARWADKVRGVPLSLVVGQLAKQEQFAAIRELPRFAPFVAEFIEELLQWDAAQRESQAPAPAADAAGQGSHA